MAKFSTKAKTNADHYNVQLNRREGFLKKYRNKPFRGVVQGDKLKMHDTDRGFRTGVYVGEDGDDPSLTMDAKKHEIDPGVTSTIIRHSWDEMIFVMGGTGWTEVNGVRYDWKPWDALHIPSWAWFRHGNDSDKPATLFTVSCEPLVTALGLGVLQEAGHAAWNDLDLSYPSTAPARRGNDPYARQVRRLAQAREGIDDRRIHTSYDEVELLPTKRGSMTTFLVDEAIGYRTSGLTQAMKVYAPNEGESMHAHPGEAWLLAVEGEGYTYIGDEPEGGEDHPWKAGDLICVDHFCWHKHNNASDTNLARVVRFHLQASLGMIWRALASPLELKLEPEWVFDQVKDPTTLEWPDEKRPD
jgi:quercetin dioxygenase-like cupin family protein